MSSFYRHLVIVRPLVLRITSPMPMVLLLDSYLRVLIYMRYMVPLVLELVLRWPIFLADLAIVFEISTDCCRKCVKIRLHSFASRPDGPCDPCVLMAAFLIC